MIDMLAFGIVVLTGVYLCALAGVSLFIPSRATRFLLGFAGSERVHYLELGIRFVVGGAFVINSPGMLAPRVFTIFGWVLLVTTAGLLLFPWKWHQRFAEEAVPRATRYITLIGLCSLALGGFILAAAIRSSAT